MNTTTCPGCNGPISRRAKLCKNCRSRANAVGEKVWTETHVPPPPARPRTVQQSQRYSGKCYAIAKIELALAGADVAEANSRTRAVRRRALTFASELFGRPVESSTGLSEIEMDIVCEHLDEVLDALETRLSLRT